MGKIESAYKTIGEVVKIVGLDTPVVKSHGGIDYIGFSNSLDVCNRIIKGNLIKKIKENIR